VTGVQTCALPIYLRLGQAQLTLKQNSDAATSLASIASDDQVSYSTRAAAAGALHEVEPPKQFNSAELTLLATTPSEQQSDQPYFVYGRIAAAANLPPAWRAAVLRAAIQTAPDSMLNWLRLRIFHAEIAQDHYEQAQVAIAPVLANSFSVRFGQSNINGGEHHIGDQTPQNTANATISGINTTYTVDAALTSPQDQRAFTLALASMAEHLGDDQQAIYQLQELTRLTSDATEIARLEGRIAVLQRRLDIARENAARRPIIHDSIEQTVLVRPRITNNEKVQP